MNKVGQKVSKVLTNFMKIGAKREIIVTIEEKTGGSQL